MKLNCVVTSALLNYLQCRGIGHHSDRCLGGSISSRSERPVVNRDTNLGTREGVGSADRRRLSLLDLQSENKQSPVSIDAPPQKPPPALPVIVPIHLKKFSFSGNAETLFSVLIMRAISSFCNLCGKNRETHWNLIQSKASAKFYLLETLPEFIFVSSWPAFAELGADSGFMFWLAIVAFTDQIKWIS